MPAQSTRPPHRPLAPGPVVPLGDLAKLLGLSVWQVAAVLETYTPTHPDHIGRAIEARPLWAIITAGAVRFGGVDLARIERALTMPLARGTLVGAVQRQRIRERDGYRCRYCGRRVSAQTWRIDHVLPRSRGGPATDDNLVTACRRCTYRKGARTLEECGMRLLPEPSTAVPALAT
jgi:hypothetical protein